MSAAGDCVREQTWLRACAKFIGRHVLHLAFFSCAVSLICALSHADPATTHGTRFA